MNNYYVYQLRLIDSVLPFYIGKGKGKRCHCHFREWSLRHDSHKNRVIKKAIDEGIEILVEILHQNLTEPEALNKEVELIAFYGRHNFGGCLTNATDGGEGRVRYIATDEARQRMSKARMGKKHSPETIAKIALSRTGKRHGDSAKKKMSNSRTGKKQGRGHTKAIRFSNWDRNPAWKQAGDIFDAWVESGKPGWVRLSRVFDGAKIEVMHRNFVSGWNPHEDPEWIEYSTASGLSTR